MDIQTRIKDVLSESVNLGTSRNNQDINEEELLAMLRDKGKLILKLY